MSNLTLFHNPGCGTSRKALALIRNSGFEPIVVTPLWTRLCRPPETVLDLLPNAQRGAFARHDGDAVVDAEGRRVVR